MPDLTVSVPTGVPASAQTITGFRVTDTARNAGAAKAPATNVTYFLSKDKLRDSTDLRFETRRFVSSLPAGTSSSGGVRIVVPAEAVSGLYWVLGCIDAAKTIAESQEGNNCKPSAAQLRVLGPNPLKVDFIRQTARAEAVETSFDGGTTVSAVGGDGTVYQLDVPDDMGTPAQVRLIPVAGITPAPGNVVARRGVMIEPAGMLLGGEGATLRIMPPTALPTVRLLGFGFAGNGSDFHLVPARRDGFGGVELTIGEFGGYGFGPIVTTARSRPTLATSVLPADLHIPASLRNRYAQRAAVKDPAATIQAANDYYREVIRPRLQRAVGGGSRYLVDDLVRETLGLLRQIQLLDPDMRPEWETEAYGLFRQILSRLFNEAHTACTSGGGDPFAELNYMMSIARQALLLMEFGDSFSASLDWWFGSGAYQKIIDCMSVEYEAGWSGTYKGGSPGNFLSSGSTSVSGVRFTLGDPNTKTATLSVPAPGVAYGTDCGGSFLRSSGTFGVKGTLISTSHYVGRYIGGRYVPDAELVTEMKLRLRFYANPVAVFRIDCGGGPSDWDLGASIGRQSLILPTKGGSAAVNDPPIPADCDVDCETAAGTLTISAAALSRG